MSSIQRPEVARQLKRARRERRLSREKLARMVDVSLQSVYRWETGYPIDVRYFERLCVVLDKPQYFFFLEDGVSAEDDSEAVVA